MSNLIVLTSGIPRIIEQGVSGRGEGGDADEWWANGCLIFTKDAELGVIAIITATTAQLARQIVKEHNTTRPAPDTRTGEGPRCTCKHHCPSREEWLHGAQCVHAPDCELAGLVSAVPKE